MLRLCRRLLALILLSSTALAAHAGAAPDVASTWRWVLQRADHHGRPFVIVDKRAARLHVFDAQGRSLGATPVLLGLTAGDRPRISVLGTRPVASLTPDERITPAGRFESEPGVNDHGEAIVWFDYEAALAIHRLRPAPPQERRAERLSSADPKQRRISYGCVVVPVEFYEQVLAPTLGRARGVVYVLPETDDELS